MTKSQRGNLARHLNQMPIRLTRNGRQLSLVIKTSKLTVSVKDLESIAVSISSLRHNGATLRSGTLLPPKVSKSVHHQWISALDALRDIVASLDNRQIQLWLRVIQSDDLITILRPWKAHDNLFDTIMRNMSAMAADFLKQDVVRHQDIPIKTVSLATAATGAAKALHEAGVSVDVVFPESGGTYVTGNISLTEISNGTFQLKVGGKSLLLDEFEIGLLESMLAVSDQVGSTCFISLLLKHWLGRLVPKPIETHRALLRRLTPEAAFAILSMRDHKDLTTIWTSLCVPAARQYLTERLVEKCDSQSQLPVVVLWIKDLHASGHTGW